MIVGDLVKKSYKIIFIIYFIILGIIVFTNHDLTNLATKLEYVSCGSASKIPKPVPQLTTMAYTILIVGAPLVLIIFSIVDIVKAIMSGNADDIMKARNKLFKKFIITAVIFLVSGIVQFVLTKVTSNDEDQNSMTACLKCFLYYDETTCPHTELDS